MKSHAAFKLACAILVLGTASVMAGPDDQGLVVHEWGTFTSLQDETGAALGGINTDDEPVPQFVHGLSRVLLLPPTELPPAIFKGTPACHRDVTMRLETPVVYFHPAPSSAAVATLDVQVKFNGGWLSEYYPSAVVVAPGVKENTYDFGPLESTTVGSLAWNNLQIGGDWAGPETTEHVWTSPRAVKAANVRTTDGEADRFLFYRGVAHLDAPLRISSDAEKLMLRGQLENGLGAKCPLAISPLWLVDIQPGGKLAFKKLPGITLDGDNGKVVGTASSRFQSGDYRARNLEDLKQSLRSALVGEGLFADEAQALLNTWELSYFKSAGLRLFFLVPRAWTDTYLPLEISTPAKIERVMVGRIELVTPTQRELLHQLAQCPHNDFTNDVSQLVKQIYQPSVLGQHLTKLGAGQESLKDAAITVPKSYQLYLRLGRFRQALVLNEQGSHPSENLKDFIATYGLRGHGIIKSTSAREASNPAELLGQDARR